VDDTVRPPKLASEVEKDNAKLEQLLSELSNLAAGAIDMACAGDFQGLLPYLMDIYYTTSSKAASLRSYRIAFVRNLPFQDIRVSEDEFIPRNLQGILKETSKVCATSNK
jgi:hypothetical protein